MTFLFGDSSPSTITIDYIDFLGRILEAGVEILRTEKRVEKALDRRRVLEESVRGELDQLEQLGGDIHGLLDPHDPLDSDRPTARCARAIGRAVAEAISNEMREVRADLASDTDRIDADVADERNRYIRTLGDLLRDHDLPRASNEIHLALDFGEHYTAQLRGQTSYGAATSIDLDIPGDSPFARQVRVSRFVPSLDIHAPERVGWIRKQVKSRRHNVGNDLDRYLVAWFVCGLAHV